MNTNLEEQDEIIHRVVPRVQIVGGAQAVVWVKMYLLVDAGVTQKVKQDFLRHAHGAEVLHFYQREVKRSETVRLGIRKSENCRLSHDESNLLSDSNTIITKLC